MSQKAKFPLGFLWGVGHSAFQVEGAPAESDWRKWTHTPGKILDSSNADVATDFWNRYEEDFALARELGAKCFRLSIAWERIETGPGVWDESALAHYEKILISCREHGLEPIVTLHHFVLPEWLVKNGGLCADDFPEEFADYSEKVAGRLAKGSARVAWWMTFNEPMVLVNMGYLIGEWPPGLRDPKRAMLAASNLVRAHIEAAARLRQLGKGLRISIAQHWRDFQAKRSWNPIDQALVFFLDHIFNRNFVRAITTGRNVWWMPGAEFQGEKISLPEGRSTIDYLGINYYGRMIASALARAPFMQLEEGPGLKSDLGWEVYPAGLKRVLENAAYFGLPIMVSENGLADESDQFRGDFIGEHVAVIEQALAQGINVFAYLHWSLTDNFEWAFGLKPRFGLVEIDYLTGKRRPRPSYEKFRRLIASVSILRGI